MAAFYREAPQINPNAHLIKGLVCGVRVEVIEDPLMQKIRWLDKLVDELAKGKPMEKILRRQGGIPMKIEQFVMAYGVEQDRLRAILPEGFFSLRPVRCCASTQSGGRMAIPIWNSTLRWNPAAGGAG